jgi:hypothetical protein
MISLQIIEGDVTAHPADAIFLPIDGALPQSATSAIIERSLGRIARSFARRHPECELIEEMEAQLDFPIALGQAASLELTAGAPHRFALLLSLLPHHADATEAAQLRAFVSRAFSRALALTDELGVASAVTPLLKGGWRLSAEQAMSCMLQVIGSAQPRHPLSLTVCILDAPGEVATMQQLARSMALAE